MRPISSQEFFECREKLDALCTSIMTGKNPVYTIGSDNYVENFQSIAKRLGTSDRFVALVYLHKHFDAIVASVVKGEIKDVESIDSRFADARNYLDILYALVKSAQLPTIADGWREARSGREGAKLADGDRYHATYDPPTCPV